MAILALGSAAAVALPRASAALAADLSPTAGLDVGLVVGNRGMGITGKNGPDQYARGVRHKTLSLDWSQYQPAPDTWNVTYIRDKRRELATYRSQGFGVALDAGLQYPPRWVLELNPNALFSNQYGDRYQPGQTGKDVANGVFNQAVRQAMATYIARVFADLGQDFSAVRAGGGWYGELHYPNGPYNGRTNSYWGYDDIAQGKVPGLPEGVAPNPVPGWVPNPMVNGTFESGGDGAWLLQRGYDTITTDAHRGGKALQKTNPGRWSRFTQQSGVQVVPGRTYNFSAWAKSSNPAQHACIQITRGSDSAQLALRCTSSTTYSQVAGSFIASEPTVKVALLSYDATNTTLTFDDVAIMAPGYTYDEKDAQAAAFWNWYIDSLVNYQNWQVAQYRATGFTGKVFVLYPSFGVRTRARFDQAVEAIGYGLSATSVASKGNDMSQGTDWARAVAALPAGDPKIVPYSTWIDGPTGTYRGDDDPDEKGWSPAKELAAIASGHGREVYGENTGTGTATTMELVFSRLRNYGYRGVYWFNENQLYSGSYATPSHLQALIDRTMARVAGLLSGIRSWR